jgi:hypothetical protein
MSRYKGFQKLITGCEDCPNYEIRYGEKRKCEATRKELPAPNKNEFYHIEFPDWCPLEDVDL